MGSLFGGSKTNRTAGARYENKRIQAFLPYELRSQFTGPILERGISGLDELISNPGGLSPNVSEAILPRLASESESIAQNYRGIQSQQAGAGARGNLPISIKSALQSALDVSQERAQRGARRDALTESEGLRRQDMGQLFKLLDMLNQFTSSGRGTAAGASAASSQASGQENAAIMSAIAAIAGAAIFASNSRFKKDIKPVRRENILDAIIALPVYEWSYKGENVRHMGPLAEDFAATFGLGSDSDSIHVIDAIGTLMAATQALAHKVDRLEAA
jgi:hypothetical protein